MDIKTRRAPSPPAGGPACRVVRVQKLRRSGASGIHATAPRRRRARGDDRRAAITEASAGTVHTAGGPPMTFVVVRHGGTPPNTWSVLSSVMLPTYEEAAAFAATLDDATVHRLVEAVEPGETRCETCGVLVDNDRLDHHYCRPEDLE